MATLPHPALGAPVSFQPQPPSSNLFDKLAIETVQSIAEYIEYDQDLCSFRLACRSTYNAVDCDNSSFWRRRFLAHFEKPVVEWKGAEGNLKFKTAYQNRKQTLKNGARFVAGDSERQINCLYALRELVVDSFSEKKDDGAVYESENLTLVKRFLKAENLLKIFEPVKITLGKRSRRFADDAEPTPTLLMRTLQVISAPMLLSFEGHLLRSHYAFPDSQIMVYSTSRQNPIFHGCHGLDVNMDFLLHSINFWRYHLLREVETTLYTAFKDLEEADRPRWWNSQLKQGVQKLGKHWKGSYAFVGREEIDDMRDGHGQNEQIQDVFPGDGAAAFQDMDLELVDNEDFPWPPLFEEHLRSLNGPKGQGARTRRAQKQSAPEEVKTLKHKSFRFEGEGQDSTEEFIAAGWLDPLPRQQGIPGWQRMTMMKYFEDEHGNPDAEALWAYEGVVLPGGQIMIGRWWSPSDGGDGYEYSGPFILWCVDGAKYEAEGDGVMEE